MTEDQWEKKVEKPILVVSLLFVFILILPAAHPLSPQTRHALDWLNIGIWLIFAIDYGVKIFLSDHKWTYIKTHPLEFLIVAIPFLRPLRSLRLLSLSAYFLKHARGTFESRLISFVFFAVIFITAPACVAMYGVERKASGSNIKTFGDTLWWAFCTLTTVGSGDKYPVTSTGRIIAVFVMISGVSLVGLITAAVASWFVGANRREHASDSSPTDQISRLADLRASGILSEEEFVGKKTELLSRI